MPTMTMELDPSLGVGGWNPTPVADLAGMLDAVDDHDEWTRDANEDVTDTFVMLSDDEHTVWYVVLMRGFDPQIDTFTLTD